MFSYIKISLKSLSKVITGNLVYAIHGGRTCALKKRAKTFTSILEAISYQTNFITISFESVFDDVDGPQANTFFEEDKEDGDYVILEGDQPYHFVLDRDYCDDCAFTKDGVVVASPLCIMTHRADVNLKKYYDLNECGWLVPL